MRADVPGVVVVLIAAGQLLGQSAALVLRAIPEAANATEVSDGSDGFCNCDCCITEVERGGGEGAFAALSSAQKQTSWDRLQCAYAPPSEMGSAGPTGGRCGSLCKRTKDDIVTAAQDPSMDTQRFCFLECEPKPRDGPDSPADPGAQAGDPCGPLSHEEALAVKDSAGNVRPPMDVPQVMSHFLVARTVSGSASSSGASAAAAAAADRARQGAAAGVQGPSPPWLSVSPAATKASADIINAAKEAQKEADVARAAFLKINEVASSAAGGLSAAAEAAAKAKTAAEEAAGAEARVHAILVGLRRRAKEAAVDAIPAIMSQMRTAAESKAKAAAFEAAAATERKMKEDAPHAGDAARKPWDEAMIRAGQTATAYLKAGDELASQSRELQTAAQAAQSQASQYMRLGYLKKAQELAVQARNMMDHAIALNEEANADYGKLSAITRTLPYYTDAAGAASYHAQVMVDPNALPPPPSLV
eukprot:TRINITY_DN11164_c0_g1_i1.p1 TRINITY_DN11164_c0_g1~~TRINITY_DN11164_c0_g1_i1.p1  ORF type:complete len:475 (-),score=149.52 TRINITY_DN11164_c0_g1_i1:215-1639(-)